MITVISSAIAMSCTELLCSGTGFFRFQFSHVAPTVVSVALINTDERPLFFWSGVLAGVFNWLRNTFRGDDVAPEEHGGGADGGEGEPDAEGGEAAQPGDQQEQVRNFNWFILKSVNST